MLISVVIPTLLKSGPDGEPWLAKAVASVLGQDVIGREGVEVEIVVAFDALSAGVVHGEHDAVVGRHAVRVRYAKGLHGGNPGTLNAGVAAARGDVMALLDDDDRWEVGWLGEAVKYLGAYEFVTASHVLVDEAGRFVKVWDYPVPSTWVMRRKVWEGVGGLDGAFRWHPDTEFLGRARAAGVRRVHLADRGGTGRAGNGLAKVGRWAEVVEVFEGRPGVLRTVNSRGLTFAIEGDAGRKAAAEREYEAMRGRFGGVPW